MKKFNLKAISATVVLSSAMFLTACGGGATGVAQAAEPSGFDTNMPIAVVSREDGSGTRGAFIELLGIERDGIDHTFVEADIQNGTSAVITTVAGNTYAMGYISLGSLNDTVSAVKIDGVAATPENVQSGTYPLFRAFYFAVGDNLTDAAQDFLNFVISAEGQEIVASRGYITVDSDAPAFVSNGATGTVVVTGSTSVFPIVELLGETFGELTSINVEVHSTGSSAGITAAIDGTADLGMTSRALREAELAQVNAVEIAYDGLAVIVNNNNPIEVVSAEEVRLIFEGELFNWSNIFN